MFAFVAGGPEEDDFDQGGQEQDGDVYDEPMQHHADQAGADDDEAPAALMEEQQPEVGSCGLCAQNTACPCLPVYTRDPDAKRRHRCCCMQGPAPTDEEQGDDDANQVFMEGAFPVEEHTRMINDELKMRAYKDGLCGRAQGKVVLEIGTGYTTGLAILAADHGAKRVYAVEINPFAAKTAAAVVANSIHCDTIKVICGDITSHEVRKQIPERADIIMCDWMGHVLFWENIWPAVHHAREHLLAPGGILLPNAAAIMVAGVKKGTVVRNATEVTCSLLAHHKCFDPVVKVAKKKIIVDNVTKGALATKEAVILEFDLMTAGADAANWEAGFSIPPKGAACEVDGLMVAWDVRFPGGGVLKTGASTSTHWPQCVLPMDKPVRICGTKKPFEGVLKSCINLAGDAVMRIRIRDWDERAEEDGNGKEVARYLGAWAYDDEAAKAEASAD